jgi:Uri superfamily endonuclease
MADPAYRAKISRQTVEYTRRRKAEDPVYRAKVSAIQKRYNDKVAATEEGRRKIRERSRLQYHAIKADPERARIYREKERIRARKRKLRDPEFAIRCHLRARVSDMIRESKARRFCHSGDLIGCTVPELQAHLERQFKRGMSWANYGRHWHIDHIIPCAKFDLTDPRQQAICFNYLNLRPCLAAENLRKNARLDGPAQLPLGI